MNGVNMMKHELLVNLNSLRALFDVPSKWVQGAPSTNSVGEHVRPSSTVAICWCLMGGVSKITYDDNDMISYDNMIDALLRSLRLLGYEGGIASWNDNPERTFEDVLAVIDQAIEFEKVKIYANK